MNDKWVLSEDGPVVEPDLIRCPRWFGTADRHVARTTLGSIFVSTVFLGLDHSFGGPEPVLWETMIFGHAEFEDYQRRYTSRAAAELGHAAAVAAVEQRINDGGADDPRK